MQQITSTFKNEKHNVQNDSNMHVHIKFMCLQNVSMTKYGRSIVYC